MGVVSNKWLDREGLMLTDVQTPFLGTPLVPLKLLPSDSKRPYTTMHCPVVGRWDGWIQRTGKCSSEGSV